MDHPDTTALRPPPQQPAQPPGPVQVRAVVAPQAPPGPLGATEQARAREAARAAEHTTEPGAWLLPLQALALKHDDAEAAAMAVLARLALRFGCERASLGWHQRGRIVLAAMSAGDPRSQQNIVRALEGAMDEALAERAIVRHPGLQAANHGAHARLRRRNGGLTITTLPILAGQRLIGALTLESRTALDANALRLAQDAALFVGPLLEMQHRLQRPLAGRWTQALSPRGVKLHARAMRPGRLAALALLPALTAIGCIPMQLEVVANARLEGGEQRLIAAPVDGFIAQAHVRPGAEVKAGEVLITLQDRELDLQRQRWLAEIAQLDRQYREALTHDEAPPIAIARAKLDQAMAQGALAESELARTRITAPFDGIVIGGDLQQAAGMPVQRGQTLLTLAPALRLKVVAEADEQDVALLAAGQNARVLFAAQGQGVVGFKVDRVSPVAATVEGRNIFEIEGAIDAAAAAKAGGTLRPGQRGVARIEAGERRVAEVAWLRAGQWLRRWVWRLLG